MRAFCPLLLCVLALGGCSGRPLETPDKIYAGAYSLYRGEHYSQALDRAGQGLKRADPQSPLYWSFRLLTAEILLGQRQAPAARAALNFELPPYARTPAHQARYLLCQGFAALQGQNLRSAGPLLESAAAFARAAGNDELIAEIGNRQGLLAVAELRFEDAAKLFHQVQDYSNGHSVPWLAIASTGNLGFELLSAHRYNEAIPYFEQAIRMARQFGAGESEARNSGNLGWCHLRLGDSDKALHYFQQAEERFRLTGNRSEEQRWLGSIGSCYLDRAFLHPADFKPAASYYLRALEIAKKTGNRGDSATWLTNLARISIEAGDLDAAERYNEEGRAVKRALGLRTAEYYSEMNAARIAIGRRKHADAIKILNGILRESPEDPTPRLQAHDLLGVELATTNKYPEAEAEFRTAIGEIERRRTELLRDDFKRAYFSQMIGFYQDYVEFLMDEGKTAEALELADSSRARTMADRLRISRSRGTQRRRVKDFQATASEMGSTLLSYSLGRNHSWLWIITPHGLSSVTLPAESEIRSLIEVYDRSIQDLRDPLAHGNPAAEKLYETLVAPALPFLGKTGRVILVPDGVLYSLNFETLPVPGPRPHYWIEDAMISIAPSLGLLNPAGGAARTKTGSLLLIGDPVSAAPEFPRLAFAAREMSAIGASLPRTRKVVLQGANAKPAAWLQSKPVTFDLIHFAAHATASVEEPLESAVILSRDGSADYRLRARDVVNMPINADLVTISACHSAGTRIYSGEGLVGLAWAFLDSGAHNVIAGLWDVDDESGEKIMERLYAGLDSGTSPAAALRQAKLELIREGGVHRKPWYWGAFQLFGTDAR
ncbi:MAG: CHAT domain-containing protein [Acidobacteriota bacterium]